MKRITWVIGVFVFSIVLSQSATAQYSWEDDLYYDNKVTYELGASLGVMNCLTDLGGGKGTGKKFIKDLNVGKTQFAGSIFLSAAYRYAFVLRAEASWGIVKADDKVLAKVKESTLGRYDRNLSFKSTIHEVMLALEIHPLYFKKYDKKAKLPRFSPYLVAGVGYFSFNPKAKLNDQWIELQPLSTEGQGFQEYPNRKEYRLKQLNFPVGAGIKYKLSPLFNVSLECMYRILHTDYLDDVSTRYIDQSIFSNHFIGDQLTNVLMLNDRQKELNPAHVPIKNDIRGNPDNNDAYFTINIKLAYVF